MTYGFSQGGYGALKFSAPLAASMSLCFSPQWSINPDDVDAFDRRFSGHYDAALRNGERIEQGDICSQNFIFYDTGDSRDAENAKRLLALGGVHAVLAPFTGHGTVRLISDARLGRDLIGLCLGQSGANPSDFRALLRRARRRSTTYLDGKLARLQTSVPRHRKFAEAALDCLPEGPAKTMAAVSFSVAVNDLRDAEKLMASVSDDHLSGYDFLKHWSLFRSCQFLTGN